MCVFVWISVFVRECWRGACEAVARVMRAVKREQLSSSLQELTILSCLLQKYIYLVLLNIHFKLHLASWWLFIQGQCFLIKVWTSDQLLCLIWNSQLLAMLLWTVGLLSLQIDRITCFDTIANIGIKVLDQTKFKWTFFSFLIYF